MKNLLVSVTLLAVVSTVTANPIAAAQAGSFDTSNPAAADATNTLNAMDPTLSECPPETMLEVESMGSDAYACFWVDPNVFDFKATVETNAKDNSPALESWSGWGEVPGVYGESAVATYTNGYRVIWSTYSYGMGQILRGFTR